MRSARYRYTTISFLIFITLLLRFRALFFAVPPLCIRFRTICSALTHSAPFRSGALFVFDFISHLILTRNKQRAKPHVNPMQSQTIKIYLDILCNRLFRLPGNLHTDTSVRSHIVVVRSFHTFAIPHHGIMRV